MDKNPVKIYINFPVPYLPLSPPPPPLWVHFCTGPFSDLDFFFCICPTISTPVCPQPVGFEISDLSSRNSVALPHSFPTYQHTPPAWITSVEIFVLLCDKHVAVPPPVTVPRLPHSPAAEMAHENVRVLTSTLLRHVHVSPHSPVSLRTRIHTHVTHTKRAPAKFGCADVIFTHIWRHIVRMSPASP